MTPNFSRLQWEVIENYEVVAHEGMESQRRVTQLRRARVFGGWLVQSFDVNEIRGPKLAGAGTGGGLTFVPDPTYQWTL